VEARKDDLRPLRLGAATLAACIVQTLNESDPSVQARFLARLDRAYASLREKEGTEFLEMLSWAREMVTGWNSPSGKAPSFLSD